MNRGRMTGVLVGFGFLAFAGYGAAALFVDHQRLYVLGTPVLAVLVFSFLGLVGVAYGLIFGWGQ